MAKYFLGLDSSTQSLSAVLIDLEAGSVVDDRSLNFDKCFQEYGTENGVLRDGVDPKVVHSSPLMWMDALDELFRQMKSDGLPLDEVLAVAGSGQQHGSVYLNDRFPRVLDRMDAGHTLAEHMGGCLTSPTSPIWMDSSTGEECEEIRDALGGMRQVVEASGSDTFERFTGPQIRRFSKLQPGAYKHTDHLALVSSFLSSVLAGSVSPIDPGDGAGMNLMDIARLTWHPQLLSATAEDLYRRLPPLAPANSMLGAVNPYFVHKYGLNAAAQAVVWSGDNPCSLIGVGLVEPGMNAISLGTSDTMFGAMSECRTDPRGEGHVFGSPAGGYMSLICFKNGSLARENLKDHYGLDWDGFSQALRDTPPGNNSGLMLPYFEPEIVPRVLEPGVRRKDLDEGDAAANIRACVEAQMMSIRIHSEWMGERPSSIYATGGASVNRELLQVMANVHQTPVFQFESTNTAAIGAALRAAQAYTNGDWKEVVSGFTGPVESSKVAPQPETAAIYDEAVKAYAAFEANA